MRPLNPREFLGIMAKLGADDSGIHTGLIGELLDDKGTRDVRKYVDPGKATINSLHKGDNSIVQVNDGKGFPEVKTQADGGAMDNAKSASEIYLGWVKEAVAPLHQMAVPGLPGMGGPGMVQQPAGKQVVRTAAGAPGQGGAGVLPGQS